MPTLPNLSTATASAIDKAKNLLTNTVSNTQVVNNFQQAAGGLQNSANNLLNNLTGKLPSLANKIPGFDNAARATNPPLEPPKLTNINNAYGKQVKELPNDITFPLKNPLDLYSSYTYIWTLSVLNSNDFNFPDTTYKKGIYNTIIARTGSGFPDRRVELTPYAVPPANPTGKFDFFIDNVRINGLIGIDKNTGNTNACGINFTVVEPFSMGLFFQSLAAAGLKEGYKYWVGMPLLLTLQFYGHIDFESQTVPGGEHTTKHFPIRITDINMDVTAEGCKYQCTAVPWNEQAFTKQIATIKSDANLKGSTVQEMLQKGEKSLQVLYNKYLAEEAKKEKKDPDKIVILFPINADSKRGNTNDKDSSKTTGATVSADESTKTSNEAIYKKLGIDDANLVQDEANLNSLGQAPMGYSRVKKDKASFGKDGETWDKEKNCYVRGNIMVKDNEGEATFKSNSAIPDIINQVLLGSDYGRQALDKDNIDTDGYINWWRVDTQIYILNSEKNLNATGRYPVIIVYRVLPFRIHSSRFLPPDELPVGVKKLQQKAIKSYNYIYTGKNYEILDFKINFNKTFYQNLNADAGRSNIDQKRQASQAAVSTAKSKEAAEREAEGFTPDPPPAENKSSNAAPNIGASLDMAANQGGPTPDDAATIAARQFHNNVQNAKDMINLEVKILGDPFYLGDSGMGNYTAQDTDHPAVNSDWAINYQRGEVYVNMAFRNPVDINHETGLFSFGSSIVPEFSGLYRVLEVENTFDKGLFTQTLQMVRMLNYESDGKGEVKEGTGKTLASEKVETVYNDVL